MLERGPGERGGWGGDHTAIEEVINMLPPSGLALKVGTAARRRCRLALTLTFQHYDHWLSWSDTDRAGRG